MAQVSLTNYDAQLAEAQRRQKLAEMLQEQANAPFDIQSYKGVQAPIPFTAVLAKALQGGMAGYQSRKADEQKAAAEQSGRQQALSDYRAATANKLTEGGAAFTPAGSNVPNPQFSAQKPSMLANLLGGGNAQPPPAAPMLPQAAPMPAAMPPPAAPMLQGAPMAQGGPAPTPPLSQEQLSAANPNSFLAQATMPPNASNRAVPIDVLNPVARPAFDFKSKAPTAKELEDSSIEMMSSSNPYARSFGQNMFERSQTQIDEDRKVSRMKEMFGGEAPAGTSKQAWNAALASGSPGEIAKIAQSAYDNAHTPAKDERTTDMKNYDFLVSNDGYKGTFGQFAIEEANRKTPRTNTSVNVNMPKEMNQALIGVATKAFGASQEKATSAAASITNSQNMIDLLKRDANKIYSGPGASARMFIDQISGRNPEKLVATRQMIKGLAEETVQARGLFKGQGPITDLEQRSAEKARSGSIDSLTIPEFQAVLTGNQKINRAVIARHKERSQKFKTALKSGDTADVIGIFDVDEPESNATRGAWEQ